MPEHGYIARSALAKFFHVDVKTLNSWEQKGLIPPPILIGSKKFFKAEEIQQFFREREQAREQTRSTPAIA